MSVQQDGESTSPGRLDSVGGDSIWSPGRHRSIIARKVIESWRETPHISLILDVSAQRLLVERAELKHDEVTLTDLFLRAAAAALRSTHYPGPVDIGLAVATLEGVVIPTIRDVAGKSIREVAEARALAVERARTSLSAADLVAPPVLTLSNLGTHGIDQFTGIIPPGQVGLLTVGRVVPRAVVDAGQVLVENRFFATLSVDHRRLDGDHAAVLLQAFAAACADRDALRGQGQIA